MLERVQQKFTRMIKEVRDKDYLDRLKELHYISGFSGPWKKGGTGRT